MIIWWILLTISIALSLVVATSVIVVCWSDWRERRWKRKGYVVVREVPYE